MTFSLKHIGLIVGIALVFVSFFFFGRRQDTYQILLLCGFVTASVSYLTILFGKERIKIRILWTAIVILIGIVQQLTESVIIDSSYRLYINQNKETLTDVSNILTKKNGDIFIFKGHVNVKGDSLTNDELAKLQEAREKLGVYLISKFDTGVYYGLWGFLDVRLGITYLPNKSQSDEQYRHITGNWFH
jgi:hypothetical protein